MAYAVYQLLSCAENVVNDYDVTCEPRVVNFGEGNILHTHIQLLNFPVDDNQYYEVFLYNGMNRLNETLSANFTKDINATFIINQVVNTTWNHYFVRVCFTKTYKSYCDKSLAYNVVSLNHSSLLTNRDCIERRCTLIIDWNNDCRGGTTVSDWARNTYAPPDTPKLDIHKNISVDIPYVSLMCSANVQKFDLLYMYQNQSKGQHKLLKVTQYLGNMKDRIVMSLTKTLQNEDKKSLAYCVKKNRNQNQVTSNIAHFEEEYDRIQQLPHANVTIYTSSEGPFETGEISDFLCNGTWPVDGRNLTWYIQDPNSSESEFIVPENQLYDRETNENILTLKLDESYHLKKLFCAEDYHLRIQYANGSHMLERYGERASSKEIILRIHEKRRRGDHQTALIWGLVLGIGASLLGLIVLVTVRARRRRLSLTPTEITHDGNEENNESNYAVAYADLMLRDPATISVPQTINPNYVEVVGVLNISEYVASGQGRM